MKPFFHFDGDCKIIFVCETLFEWRGPKSVISKPCSFILGTLTRRYMQWFTSWSNINRNIKQYMFWSIWFHDSCTATITESIWHIFWSVIKCNKFRRIILHVLLWNEYIVSIMRELALTRPDYNLNSVAINNLYSVFARQMPPLIGETRPWVGEVFYSGTRITKKNTRWNIY